MLNAIKLGVSFTWNNTASVSSSQTITISPHHVGRLEFEPRMNRTSGTLTVYDGLGIPQGTYLVTAYSPIKLPSGVLDGWVIAKETDL